MLDVSQCCGSIEPGRDTIDSMSASGPLGMDKRGASSALKQADFAARPAYILVARQRVTVTSGVNP